MKNIINFVIKDINEKQRVDYYLSKKYKDLSRNKIKNLILKNLLQINDVSVNNPSTNIKIGDKIYLKIINDNQIHLKPYNYKLDIVFEDKDLIIINKRSGISMHPGAGNYDKTIVNALINKYGKKLSDSGDKFRPGIVHRIDKNTSGLIVIAKNNKCHEILSNQFKFHSVSRIYLALVWGKLRPQKGKIENFIRRSSRNRQLMEVNLIRGKKAITNYKTIEIFENKNIPTFSLVECILETGRTHQIRVHLSNLGNPILGDNQYKKKFKKLKDVDEILYKSITNLNRQFLHAKTIGFQQPIKGDILNFNSKLPEELENILKKLRKTY